MGNSMTPLQAAKEPSPEQCSQYPSGASFWSEKPDAENTIRYAKSGPASEKESPAITVCELVNRAVKKHPNKPAVIREKPEKIALVDGKAPPACGPEDWQTWTWAEYVADVRKAARSLVALGYQPHDACTIFGYNSPEWMIGALAAMFAGGKASGVYPSDTAEQFQYKVHHSRTSIVLVETLDHLKIVQKTAKDLPYLKHAVVWTGKPTDTEYAHVKVHSWTDFMAKAGAVTDAQLDAVIANIRPGHACSLIYTSGTTGQPKAVMVTHDNIVFEARVVVTMGIQNIATTKDTQERILSYLPLSHVAGQMVDILSPVAVTGFLPGYCTVFFARPYDLKIGTLAERLRMVKPTIFLGVPRVWEKIAEKMRAVGAKVTGTKKKIATWAKAKGLEYQENMQLGGSGRKPSNYGLAQKLVLNKVKQALGLDEMKFGFSGAAPMTTDTLEYFGALGININEVYGMSECTGATTWSTDEAHIWGTVGFPLLGMEVKIMRPGGKECPRAKGIKNVPEECQGEIVFRGRHIMMGYLANEAMGPEHVEEIRKKNAEAIDSEGWLHSGDMGIKTDTGMIKITGRYKELIIGAGGENIAPVPIEDEVKRLAAGIVSNIQMVGDKRKYNVALITLVCKGATGEKPGTNELEASVTSKFPGLKTVEDACKSKELIKFLDDVITQTNKNGAVCPSNAARISKYTILPLDISVETDELTATLKLKRNVVEKKHIKTLDAMFEDNSSAMFFKHVG